MLGLAGRRGGGRFQHEIRQLVADGVAAEAVDQAVEVRSGGIVADQLGESAVPRFIKRAD